MVEGATFGTATGVDCAIPPAIAETTLPTGFTSSAGTGIEIVVSTPGTTIARAEASWIVGKIGRSVARDVMELLHGVVGTIKTTLCVGAAGSKLLTGSCAGGVRLLDDCCAGWRGALKISWKGWTGLRRQKMIGNGGGACGIEGARTGAWGGTVGTDGTP